MSDAPKKRASKGKFNPWPWGIGLGLTIVVVVNLYVVYLSRQNAPTLTRSDYYQAGVDFEQTLEAKRASQALGWQPEVSVCPAGSSEGICEVAFRLKDADGRALAGLSGTLVARRADSATHDAKVGFDDMGHGLYIAKVPISKTGYWRLATTFTAEGQTPWLDARRVHIDSAAHP
ncbi:MAG: FixH family protein [Bradymonadia bacterium]